MKLPTWDFQDKEANGVLQQVNRQKSARNLIVTAIDKEVGDGEFFDPKKGATANATLYDCDCSDFNLAGLNPRKTFKPCMHIYRLAMEIGLIGENYECRQRYHARITEAMRVEVENLKVLPVDVSQWGGWNEAVHQSGIQKNRQYRAYAISESNKWIEGDRIHGYRVALDFCACMDFADRNLPCKHIYTLAIELDIPLPFTPDQYLLAKSQGVENVFMFE